MPEAQTKKGIGMTVAACLWLGLFPLLQFGSYARITLDKWILMLVLLGVTLLCLVPDIVMRRLSLPRLLPVVFGVSLLLWVVLSFLFSPYPKEPLLTGTSARREGVISQLCYFALFLLFAFSRVRFRAVLYSAAGGVAVFAAVVCLQRAGLNPFGLYPSGRSYFTNYEFQGTIGNIDMGTGYLLILSGLFVSGLVQSVPLRGKKAGPVPAAGRFDLLPFLASLGGLLFCISLILTMDVQFGLLTLAALAVFVLLRGLPKWWLRLIALLSVLTLAFLAVWFWPGQGGGLWELHEILHGRVQLSFGSNRIAVWLYSLRMSGERLFFGTGPDSFSLRFNEYLKTNGLAIPAFQGTLPLPTFFDNPHNEYVAWLANCGLPAVLLFTALILFSLLRVGPGKKKAASRCWQAAVFCYAVQAFFSFSVCLVAPLFWVVLGLCSQDRPCLTGPETVSLPASSPAP